MEIIARIRTDFPTKFGVPRQSGLVDNISRIIFEPPYRNPDALRGLEGYSHIWAIWGFSEVNKEHWSATVRPPRLGGNTRVGVFATRSPFRPNPIGLSCLKLTDIEWDTPEGAVLVVSGADMMDGTPIYDIKPYLPHIDAHPEAAGGFASAVAAKRLTVHFPPELIEKLPPDSRAAACEVLAQDPRPHYQNDPERRYGMPFAGMDIRFTVNGDELTVTEVVPFKREENSK